MSEGGAGERRFAVALGAALAVAVAARFVRLEADPAWGIVSRSGEFLTDEGWYTKSAQLHLRTGAWTAPHDTVWFSHNALYSLIQRACFELLGAGIVSARLVSATAFCATLAGVWAIVRPSADRTVALASCLAAAVTLPGLTYSRMALAEPTAVAFSVLALAAWTRLPRGPVACTAGLLLAAAACFVKVSFLFTLVALVLLALGEAADLARRRSWGKCALSAAAALAVPAAAWFVQQRISALDAAQAETFGKWHIETRVDELAVGAVVANEAKIVYHLLVATGCVVPIAAVLLGGWAALRRRTLPVPATRGTLALSLWLLGGVSFFGLFSYQPARYLYFAAFPLCFLAVATVASLVPDRRRAAVAGMLLLHAAAEAPGYVRWLSRDDLGTADRAAREIVARMDLRDGPVGLVGGTSSFVSLYDARILPLDFREDWLRERVDRVRPGWLLTVGSRAGDLAEQCPGLVRGVEPVASFRIMENYYTGEDHRLYRIVYAE